MRSPILVEVYYFNIIWYDFNTLSYHYRRYRILGSSRPPGRCHCRIRCIRRRLYTEARALAAGRPLMVWKQANDPRELTDLDESSMPIIWTCWYISILYHLVSIWYHIVSYWYHICRSLPAKLAKQIGAVFIAANNIIIISIHIILISSNINTILNLQSDRSIKSGINPINTVLSLIPKSWY